MVVFNTQHIMLSDGIGYALDESFTRYAIVFSMWIVSSTNFLCSYWVFSICDSTFSFRNDAAVSRWGVALLISDIFSAILIRTLLFTDPTALRADSRAVSRNELLIAFLNLPRFCKRCSRTHRVSASASKQFALQPVWFVFHLINVISWVVQRNWIWFSMPKYCRRRML